MHDKVIDHFLQRLSASINRSPLLRVNPSKTRLLDCSQLKSVSANLPTKLVRHIVEGKRGGVDIDVPLPPKKQGTPLGGPEMGEDKPVSRKDRDRALLYKILHDTLPRVSSVAKRETGVHALWLAYPILYAEAPAADTTSAIRAPLLLWPVQIERDTGREGRVRITRLKSTPPHVNQPLAEWVRRQFNLTLPPLSTDALSDLNWKGLESWLHSFAGAFQGLEPLDLAVPFQTIPKKVAGWKKYNSPCLLQAAVLGYFRWQNEAIIADLHAIKKAPSVSGVVTAFISGTLPRKPVKQPDPTEEDQYLVYPADFSQERVTWAARQGPGVVMHGPPGTGKSQTIVNLIADALAHNRTVLMISQKQAATRVVLERLRAVGLADLCIDVHDAEADRIAAFKAIREQVKHLREQPPPTPYRKRTSAARRLGELRQHLDNYNHALYGIHPAVGLSYRQLLADEAKLIEKSPNLRPISSLEHVATESDSAALEDLVARVKAVGDLYERAAPLTNPWIHRRPTVHASPNLRRDVQSIARELRAHDAAHLAYIRDRGRGVSLPPDIETFADHASDLLSVYRLALDSPSAVENKLFRSWLKHLLAHPESANTQRRACAKAVTLAKRAEASRLDEDWAEILSDFGEHGLSRVQKDATDLLRYQTKWWRTLSGTYRQARRSLLSVDSTITSAELWERAESLVETVAAKAVWAELASLTTELVPGTAARLSRHNVAPYVNAATDALASAETVVAIAMTAEWSTPLVEGLLTTDVAVTRSAIDDLTAAVDRVPVLSPLEDCFERLSRFLAPTAIERPRVLSRSGQSMEPWIRDLVDGLNGLDSASALARDRRERRGALGATLDALEKHEAALVEEGPAHLLAQAEGAKGEQWCALLQYTAYQVWKNHFIADHPALFETSPEQHAQQVSELRDLVAQKRSLEAAAILSRWRERQVHVREAPWERMFQLRRSKNGEAKRLREAVALSLPEGLQKLRPCWISTPGAVAQVFPLLPDLFDVVIFDEASQCPLEQAIPAIYRSKTVVVSGDAKQLPPTSFFSSSSTGVVEEDLTAEATDQPVPQHVRVEQLGVEQLMQSEDLLQAAIGTLREYYLQVHYRSVYPELIQFSNDAFYGGELEAPPPASGHAPKQPPIRYIEAGGTYLNHTNREEAKAVIQLLRDYWLTGKASPTLGVVTFNQRQRELIEDLVDHECRTDERFRVRHSQELVRATDNQDVGFFVKNLENVQGDERDVIIFSTTFGPDRTGRFFRRFGPVGQAGGERRLNVAISRAKREVVVVGSMPIEEISPTLRTLEQSLSDLTPACYLQLYLAYARAVSNGDKAGTRSILNRLRRGSSGSIAALGPESPFEEEVLAAIEQLGYTADCQVGDGGFRIDLAIRHPGGGNFHILGVECDGATYHSGHSARTRDVWRQDILEQRGWRFHRIWSSRWWSQRSAEINKLREAIEDAVRVTASHDTPTASGSEA